MKSIVARTFTLLMTLTLLVACGQGTPTGSTGSTSAASTTEASAAPSTTNPASSTTAPSQTSPASATSAVTTTSSASSAGATSAAATTAAGSGEAIPIGIAVAQSSNVALLGQDQIDGAKVAESYFNKKGGINGKPFKLVYQDTGGDEAGAINAYQTLINNDKVVGIVGPTLSQQAFAADKIADQAKVPVLGPSNTAKGIPQIGDYIARVSAPVAVVAPTAIQAALNINKNIKKVAVAYAQDDAFSKSETGTFQNAITSTFKLDLVTVQTFSTKDTDFTTQATNILNLQPDLVVISGLTSDGGNLVKQLRDLGYKGLIVGGNGFNSSKLFSVCKAQCDGILIAQAYSYQAQGPINDDFKAAYKTLKQSDQPPQLTAQMFTGVQVFVEALSALDKQTPIANMPLDQLRTALNKQILGGIYNTPLGQISFTPEGEINQKQFYVAQIKMNPDGASGVFNFVQ